ncbi:MAG: 3-deoxy-7-phosphoheptulonate synthase class II [Pseudomonadota bacterium]
MRSWSPESWLEKTIKQMPHYADQQSLDSVNHQLSQHPPLVTVNEIVQLKKQLVQAATGKRFLLQGGDCAESFSECTTQNIENKLKILLQMSLILVHGLRKPVIRVGRLAGQYAKPRSADEETIDGVTLPCYRGDLINGLEFNEASRIPDPERMLRGYAHSSMTLNYLRALVHSGFADLHHPENWDLNFVEHSPKRDEYLSVVNDIQNSIEFFDTIAGLATDALQRVDFFASHEALNLHYEQALTRKAKDGNWYCMSTHLPWVGMRTAFKDSAHIEYLAGIHNPVAMKVGPELSAEELIELIEKLNPNNELGRLTLIHRFGVDKIEKGLPEIIRIVQKAQKNVLWICDPMHGNTRKTESGIKTREFADILGELQHAFKIHADNGSILGGAHFELTGENVTECTGGARGLTDSDLHQRYKSLVDPRLNYEQALELAMQIVKRV